MFLTTGLPLGQDDQDSQDLIRSLKTGKAFQDFPKCFTESQEENIAVRIFRIGWQVEDFFIVFLPGKTWKGPGKRKVFIFGYHEGSCYLFLKELQNHILVFNLKVYFCNLVHFRLSSCRSECYYTPLFLDYKQVKYNQLILQKKKYQRVPENSQTIINTNSECTSYLASCWKTD